MKLIGLLYLVWISAALASVAAVAISLARHGLREFWRALLCSLGTVLMAGFVLAAIGASEGYWTARSPGLWIMTTAGLLGIGLQILGWRAVLRPRAGPGRCKGCGYDITGLARCPECGAEVATTP